MPNDKTRLLFSSAMLIGLSGILIWWLSQPTTYPSPETGQKVADDFLSAIRSAQAESAWQSTTTEFKSAQGRESFLAFVKKHDFLSMPLEFDSAQVVDVQGQPRSELVYRVPQTKTTVRLVLGREAGTWKVDRLTVN